jgi:predicted nucleotidyltransferase
MEFHGISISSEAIANLCRRHRIRRLALFGSVLRDDFGPQSDIDVLVEFEPGAAPGFGFIAIQDELSAIFGRPVDLHTPASLSRYFREEVLHEAESLYDAA